MKKKILLVDPSSGLRDVLERVVAQSEHPSASIVEAENGVEGLRRLAQDPEIALVLSQVDLAFVDAARAQGDVPMILLSEERREQELSEALSRGAAGYLNQPLSPEFLRLVVDENLR